MNPLMEKLHDIEGIDPVSWWPLGIGWWVLICFITFISILTGLYIYRKIRYNRSWKRSALKELQDLENRLDKKSAREIAAQLSEYIRRIAVKRFSRKECAGLVGDIWLQWLALHDPKNFDWKNKGNLLKDASYAPKEKIIPVDDVKEVLNAIKNWVR